jgi:hypothetical protein
VLHMRDKSRAYLDQQRLQFRILRTGNQGLVDRIDHGLVIGDLIIDVGLIECGSFEILEICNVRVPRRL